LGVDRDTEVRLEAVSGRAAARVVPMLVDWFAPTSVIDVGCNAGVWLRAFVDLGVDDVIGVDQPEVGRARLMIPPERFVPADLAQPLGIDRTFDLALCLEVIEHVPATASQLILDELVAFAPAIVFSAAVPGQGGDHHVNERWGSWWDDHLVKRGLVRFDVLRHALWDDPGVQWWYAQNIAVYTVPDHPAVEQLRNDERPIPIDVVHPRLFTEALARPPTTRESIAALPGALRRSFQTRVLDRFGRTR